MEQSQLLSRVARGPTVLLLLLAQDLALDIPDAAHQLSLFLGRIIVDEALPPSFLTSVLANLRNDSLGVSVVQATGAPPCLAGLVSAK